MLTISKFIETPVTHLENQLIFTKDGKVLLQNKPEEEKEELHDIGSTMSVCWDYNLGKQNNDTLPTGRFIVKIPINGYNPNIHELSEVKAYIPVAPQHYKDPRHFELTVDVMESYVTNNEYLDTSYSFRAEDGWLIFDSDGGGADTLFTAIDGVDWADFSDETDQVGVSVFLDGRYAGEVNVRLTA